MNKERDTVTENRFCCGAENECIFKSFALHPVPLPEESRQKVGNVITEHLVVAVLEKAVQVKNLSPVYTQAVIICISGLKL